MTEYRQKLISTLDQIITDVDNKLTDDQTFYERNGWDYPLVNRSLIKNLILDFKTYLLDTDFIESEDLEKTLEKLSQFWESWRKSPFQHIANSSYSRACLQSLDYLLRDSYYYLKQHESEISVAQIQKEWRSTDRSLSAIKTRLNVGSEETKDLEAKIELINTAVETSNRLPHDIESLKKARSLVAGNLNNVRLNSREVKKIHEDILETQRLLKETKDEIDNVLKKSHQALASATSSGLAAAFGKRAETLQWSSRCWVAALLVSLIAAVVIGWIRFNSLFALLNQGTVKFELLILNFLFSCALISAPLWFAWLATKRVGYLFKLVEDYAFKASTSTAYEGFRREASHHGDEMEERVLSSTLTRFDEPPLRLVDDKVAGSPWHELFASEEAQHAIKAPGFGEALRELIKKFSKTTEKIGNAAEKVGNSAKTVSDAIDKTVDSVKN